MVTIINTDYFSKECKPIVLCKWNGLCSVWGSKLILWTIQMSARYLILPTNSVVVIAEFNEWNATKLTEHSSFSVCSSVLTFFDKEAGHWLCIFDMDCTNERMKVFFYLKKKKVIVIPEYSWWCFKSHSYTQTRSRAHAKSVVRCVLKSFSRKVNRQRVCNTVIHWVLLYLQFVEVL